MSTRGGRICDVFNVTDFSTLKSTKSEDYRCFNFLFFFVCHSLFNFFVCSTEAYFTKNQQKKVEKQQQKKKINITASGFLVFSSHCWNQEEFSWFLVFCLQTVANASLSSEMWLSVIGWQLLTLFLHFLSALARKPAGLFYSVFTSRLFIKQNKQQKKTILYTFKSLKVGTENPLYDTWHVLFTVINIFSISCILLNHRVTAWVHMVIFQYLFGRKVPSALVVSSFSLLL